SVEIHARRGGPRLDIIGGRGRATSRATRGKQRAIRCGTRVLGIFARQWRARDARGYGDGHRRLRVVPNRRTKACDGSLKPTCDLASDIEWRAGQENRELVSTVPSDDVAAAESMLKHARDGPEHVVA